MPEALGTELSGDEAAWLDRAIERGVFRTRDEAIHAMLARAMSIPPDDEIVRAYRQAQAAVEEDAAVGGVAATGLARRHGIDRH